MSAFVIGCFQGWNACLPGGSCLTYSEGLVWEEISFCSDEAQEESCEKLCDSGDRRAEDFWIDYRGRDGKGGGDWWVGRSKFAGAERGSKGRGRKRLCEGWEVSGKQRYKKSDGHCGMLVG